MENKKMPDKTKRVYDVVHRFCDGNFSRFSTSINVTQQNFNRLFKIDKRINKYPGVSDEILELIENTYNVRKEWLLTGEGEMLKGLQEKAQSKNLIPFYDDVASIGGHKGIVAAVNSVSTPTEHIDAGDWFREATSAIRHYGDSMDEYPSGCILALKEVLDRELLIPGRDYTIETSEYRVTKRVQKGAAPDYITAYSTNTETYPDGKLIHEPFDIPLRAITRISLVLGYVVKKNGGTLVFCNSNK